MTSQTELLQVQQALKEAMGGFVNLRAASSNEPYLGHKGSTTPMRITLPGHLLEPPSTQDLTLDMIARNIFDERSGRCYLLMYPDTDLGRQLSSTVNIVGTLP
jgi:hypothetical protein